jgi:exosome complex component RRP40
LAPTSRLLNRPPCAILSTLGEHVQFEIAVGMNGLMWVNSPDPTTTVLVTNAVLSSELLTESQAALMGKKLLERVKDM